MSSKLAFITLALPLCYLAVPAVYLFAALSTSSHFFDYLHVSLIIAIPALTFISFLAMVLNRAPVIYSVIQGAFALVASIALPTALESFPYENAQLHRIMWAVLFVVVIVSPVIGTVAGITMARKASPKTYPLSQP
ncbi:MAG: hypothetical protein Q4P05_08025 [Actinomycetaceae bacterium]|nr:hypothetical protein [Actinomycetaceae bacterium]